MSSKRDSTDGATWVFAIITGIVAWIVHRFVSIFTPQMLRDAVEVSDRKNLFDGPASTPDFQNASEAYEKMCLIDPLEHKNDPRIPGLLEQYRKIIHGEIADPEATHIPSEYVEGRPNPDYLTYLKNQHRINPERTQWMVAEIERVSRVKEERDVINEYGGMIMSMGFPPDLMAAALLEDRINALDAEQWKRFVSVTKEYLKDYEDEVVYHFMKHFTDTRFFEPEILHKFSVFYKYGVPIKLNVELSDGRITMEQAELIIHYQDETDCTWEEAVRYVLEYSIERHQKEELSRRYREMTGE